MAVKQNNTEASGAATSNVVDVNNVAGVVAAGVNIVGANNNKMVNVGGASNNVIGVSSVNAKKTIADANDVSGNIESTGCSITKTSVVTVGAVKTTKLADKSNSNLGNVGNKSKLNEHKANSDLSKILQIINLVEDKRKLMPHNDILRIYQHIIIELSRVQLTRQLPEDLKRFKEDIVKVGAFFGSTTDQRHYLFYLRIVCSLVTQIDANEPPPSCAIAVIFQLFSSDMVIEAVQSLLEMEYPDQSIKQTVHLLCDWMRMCNFCHNLNLWIFAILNGLQRRQKFGLIDEIALENVEYLFISLIVPVLRPKVAPIVFHMLSITEQPQVFHKILPKIPLVLPALQQQSSNNEEQAEDIKQLFKQLIDTTTQLMVRFHGYDALYAPVIDTIKDICPTYNYMRNDENGLGNDEITDISLLNNNAKVGLVNLGNTCYMNSVLQALAMTKEFVREILLSQSPSPLLLKMRQQIALMLYSQRYELTPSRVLNATRPPGFSPGVQQDSSEFLGYLLETLHEQEIVFRKGEHKKAEDDSMENDVGPIAKSLKQETQSIEFNANTETCNKLESTNVNVTNNEGNVNRNEALAAVTKSNATNLITLSTIDKTFTGKLATTYKCLTCGWKSRNIDSFRDMQLSFPEVENDCASNYSVQDLIDYYCSPEKLDGDNQYYCERCKNLSDAERYINVVSPPKNLILTLKHFKYDQKYHMRAKLMHKVFHDEKVSVKVCAVETLDDGVTVHYDLYASVVHSGFSMDSGHYYTYAADSADQWYKFNDDIVTQSKSEELHNLTPPNTPYILFYQMSARSSADNTANEGPVVKIEMPLPLALNDLPELLRDYVTHDNCLFAEELRLRRFKAANVRSLQNALKVKGKGGGGSPSGGGGGRGYNNDDSDDNDTPPPAGGCGGNALNINVNRFVY